MPDCLSARFFMACMSVKHMALKGSGSMVEKQGIKADDSSVEENTDSQA